MAALNPTPANFRLGSNNARLTQDTAGDAVDRFHLIYRHSTGMKLASSETEEEARATGIVAVAADADGIVSYVASGGYIESTASLWVQGRVYGVSSTPGRMIDVNELADDEYVTIVGYAVTDKRFHIQIIPTGITVAI